MSERSARLLPGPTISATLETLPATPSLEQIERLEDLMRELPGLTELEVVHHFAPGVYCRELRIPAGCLLTGKIHRTEHLNILSVGEITVWTEGGMRRLKAPFTLLSKRGTKRVGFAHTDCVWTTVHPTDETDLERLEAELIEPPAPRAVTTTTEPEQLSCHG